jgi:hypothetical protein
MLNYNLNILEPLKQDKKNEDVRPPISWSLESYATASDSSDLGERTFATMSITAVGTNCVLVSQDDGGYFTTDAQYPVTASMTGSNWPITGSTTMSLYTAGITYDPLSTNQYYFEAISASAVDIYNNPAYTGSKITNNFLASEFYRFYTEGRVYHTKGNVYNPVINWAAINASPSTTINNVNGFTASFNIVKDKNVSLVSLPQLTGSNYGAFNNNYALNITSSLSASVINNTTGSTTMSIIIPEAGINTSSILLNSTSAGLRTISASFIATNNNPYNITASVIMNKGNIWNADVKWLVTGSNADSYSMYTIPTKFVLTKDVNVDPSVIDQNVVILDYGVSASISGVWQSQYAFNFKNDITESGTYPIYQVHTYPTTSLSLTPAGTSSVRYDSSSLISYTEFPYTSSYNLTASAWINKIPALDATIIALGGGGMSSGNKGGSAGGFIQYDVPIIPNVNYEITQIGLGAELPSPTGSNTLVKFWLGPIKENGTGSIIAEGANSVTGGAAIVRYGSENDPITIVNRVSTLGYSPNDGSAGGGGGILSNATSINGGINLGGAGAGGSASLAPTLYFQSSSFTWTSSFGKGADSGNTNSGDGIVILAHSGSAKLNVPTGTITTFSDGVTWYLIQSTGSFSYNVEPKPNPEEQKYIWRAETLVIAGGGAGGNDEGGGGGAGGYSYNPYVWYGINKSYTINVGNGCPSKTADNAPLSGSDSYIVQPNGNTLIFSKGGGNGYAKAGGSGGGASNTGNGGLVIPGYTNLSNYASSSQIQGFIGGVADPSFLPAGGGGGASQSGSNYTNPTPGSGGTGKYTLDFTPIGVCGGGDAINAFPYQTNVTIFGGGIGSQGGGNGTGSAATSFGSGGGGARGVGFSSGAGGNGLVQIRYAGTQRATGGQIQTALISGSYYTLHTFTASGTFTPIA